jgi:colicin import membrane protein
VSRVVASDKYLAGGLATLVHLFLFVILVFGVSWKRLPDVPVYADMWSDLPEPVHQPVSRRAHTAPPPPRAKLPDRADIALKAREAARKREAELKLEAEKKHQEEEKRRQLAEDLQRQEQARLAQEAKQLQLRQEQERQAAEQKKQAQAAARKNLDALLAAQLSKELNQESRDISRQVTDTAQLNLMAEYVSRIRQKIRGEIRLPAHLQGNPEVVYRVDLLPNGDVVRLTQVRSSGQPAYDQEVERAIWKASPLPLPPDRDLAASFRTGLELKFKPYDR